MNLPLIVSLGLAALVLSAWLALVAWKPRRWRARWMQRFGVQDDATERAEKRAQERQLAFFAGMLAVCLLAVAGSCVFWTHETLEKQARSKDRLREAIIKDGIKAHPQS
jgi:cytochrome c-type biogenesis protein CcmH/NrfG